MSIARRYDPDLQQWVPVVIGAQGPTGPTGDDGIDVAATPPGNTNILWLDTSTSGLENQNLADIAGITRTKGDLIVGGSSAWVDLATGTNGQVLKANSTATNGIAWENIGDLMPIWPNTSDGAFIHAGGSTGSLTNTTVTAVGCTLTRAATLSAITVSVGAGGSADATVRLMIFSAAATGRPGDLYYDCGTVATASGGYKTLTLAVAQTLSAGVWFFATTLASGTSPTLHGYGSATSGGAGNLSYGRGSTPDNNLRVGSYYTSTSGGAAPNSPSWTLGMGTGVITANIGMTFTSVP